MSKKVKIEENNKKENEKYTIMKEKSFDKNLPLTKLLIFLGTIVLGILIILVMKHFFVDKNNIAINYSTEKKLEYIAIDNEKELISTQRYVSDLGYNIRYDVERFKVFKYKNQDIYKFVENEGVLVLVEKASLPSDCSSKPLENGYSNCYKFIDETMDEYYITSNNKTYRVLVKASANTEHAKGIKVRISYMISTFIIDE